MGGGTAGGHMIFPSNRVRIMVATRAQALLMAQGNCLLFLPPCSPDLNPIEMAFSKLKTLIRKGAARTYQALWNLVGEVCDLFPAKECQNDFRAAGYETT